MNVKGSKPANERREAVGPDSGRLHETPSSSLSINFFESFILLPLLDDTQSRKQQAQDDSHEAIDRCEDIVECHIREIGDGCDAKVFRNACIETINKFRTLAETSNFWRVTSVEITTALELVLQRLTNRRSRLLPQWLEIRSQLQCEEPDTTADNANCQRIDEKNIVENDQTEGDVISLDDSPNRDKECQY